MDKKQFAQTQPLHILRAQMKPERLAKIEYIVANRQHGLTLVMENVMNPHNMFAIARSCDAFGVQTLNYTNIHGRQFEAEDIGQRSSRSARRWVDITYSGKYITGYIAHLKSQGTHVAATVATGNAASIYGIDWTLPAYKNVVILLGNERSGLSEEAVTLADSRVTIPMLGMVVSVNVSVAAAIIAAEVVRQRNASEKSYCLPDDEAAALTERFIRLAY